jgi:tetratricopeptide (TPR) repeat protein
MRNRLIALLVFLIVAPAMARENSTDLYKEGVEQFLQGNYKKAEALFKKTIEVSPWYTLGYYGLGRVYLREPGKVELAVKMLQRSVFLDKNLAKGHFYLGMALQLDKKYPLALHAYKEAYRIDSTIIQSLYNIGVIYDIMKQRHKSFFYFRKYKEERNKEESDIIF